MTEKPRTKIESIGSDLWSLCVWRPERGVMGQWIPVMTVAAGNIHQASELCVDLLRLSVDDAREAAQALTSK